MNKINQEKYDKVFCSVFNVQKKDLKDMRLKESEQWDSVSHILLISSLEEEFGIDFLSDDIFDIKTYDLGLQILQEHYGIN